MVNEKILENAKMLYDYLNVFTEVSKSDIIVGLGCMDTGIPSECAKLYKDGYGKLIVFSGNVGKGTEGVLDLTEAERFQKIAKDEGIPEEKILLEKEATNTYENYKFTKRMLFSKNINYKSIIIVQKPYVKRRCIAIAEIELKDKEFFVTSENLSFEEFIKKSDKNNTMSIDEIINELVGEISIILEGPKYSVQSKQIINKEVLSAYQFLIANGYTKYKVNGEQFKKVLEKWEKVGLI